MKKIQPFVDYLKTLITPDHVNSVIRGLVKASGGALVAAGYMKGSMQAEYYGIATMALGQFASSVFHFDNQKPEEVVTPIALPQDTKIVQASNAQPIKNN